MNNPSPEILTAYVDGELDDISRREIETAIRTDETLAATVERLRSSRHMLKQAFAKVIDVPVPARLTETLGSADHPDNVVPLSTAKRPTARWMPLALAASVSLTVGVLVGLIVAEQGPQTAPETAANLLQNVLDTLPTGGTLTSPDQRTVVTALSSFRVQDGRICREFEQRALAGQSTGIACRDPHTADWQTEIQVTTSRSLAGSRSGESYVPAAGGLDPLEWAFDRLGAAPALDAAEEARLISRQWRE